MEKVLTFLILLFTLAVPGYSQQGPDRINAIASQLETLAEESAGLNELVEFNVSGATIPEVVRAIGLNHNLNLSVNPDVTDRITHNFSNARVLDVILFLCKEYQLDVSITGNIINLKKYQAKTLPPPPPPVKELQINYDPGGQLLSLDLQGDTLDAVVKEITRRSGKNIIVSPEAGKKLINIYLRDVPFENAADKLAYASGLLLSKTPDGVYVLEKPESVVVAEKNPSKSKLQSRGRGFKGNGNIDVEIDDHGNVSVAADNVQISEVLDVVSKEAGVHYMMYTVPKGETSLFLEGVSFDQFLDHLLTGSDLTYKLQDSIYLVGNRNFEGLRHTELLRLQNRTIDQVKEAIPAELKKEVELFEFKELNGFVLSGSKPKIAELKEFIRQIDQVVPLITIDVMIVDISNTRSTKTGLTFGLGGAGVPQTTTGTTSGGLDVKLNSKSINNLLNAFNGFGSINLGKVTPAFYVNLRAMESEGLIKTRSTPRLSTINGNEATLSIGEMTYYLEISNNYIGTQNPALATQQNYKSVNADLTVTINPVVSGDEQVTLSIEVNQSDFTTRINENAPPGTVTRKFKSIIRVKNEEMVMLGGLESNKSEKSGTGLPFINRIPVLKYLFGTRDTKKAKTKLTIFIKPTIHY